MSRNKASHMKRVTTGLNHSVHANPEGYENPALVQEEERRKRVPVTYRTGSTAEALKRRRLACAEAAREAVEMAIVEWLAAAARTVN